MKFALLKVENNEINTIGYFENESKGISDFCSILNTVLLENNINLIIGRLEK